MYMYDGLRTSNRLERHREGLVLSQVICISRLCIFSICIITISTLAQDRRTCLHYLGRTDVTGVSGQNFRYCMLLSGSE